MGRKMKNSITGESAPDADEFALTTVAINHRMKMKMSSVMFFSEGSQQNQIAGERLQKSHARSDLPYQTKSSNVTLCQSYLRFDLDTHAACRG